jgi:hypothetical protein
MRAFLSNPFQRLFAIILLGALLLPGCGGCTGNPDANKTAAEKAAEKKKQEEEEKQKKLDDFYLEEVVVKPNDRGKVDDQTKATKQNLSRIGYVKPGHWASGSLPATANNFDFQGNLVARCNDSSSQQIPTENTNYQLTMTRPISLAKQQRKEFEVSYYIPRRFGASAGSVSLQHDFQYPNGRTLFTKIQGAILMPEYQYYMVVLSTEPATYKYLDFLPSVKIENGLEQDRALQFYRITYPTIDQSVPLPDHSLNWTSIAYLIWDDLDPSLLTPDQQQAMIDWLHFGGQLVVNGPVGYTKLKNSFLESYLPISAGEPKNLQADDIQQINEYWSVPIAKRPAERRLLKLTAETTLVGLDMKLSPHGSFVAQSDDLVAESRVGRGRIVVAGFSLKSRQVKNWQSMDSFFNTCLLRRPPRKFDKDYYENVFVSWDQNLSALTDPMLSTTLRFASRDLGASGTPIQSVEVQAETEQDFPTPLELPGFRSQQEAVPRSRIGTRTIRNDLQFRQVEKDAWHYGGFRNSAQSGVAGWNDNSGISNAARDVLKESAGIVPPSSQFVLSMLAGYLVVLVPLNWLFFRLIGRLEWAWVAAPIIAICGAVVVVRMASLDIGFARSKTEIAVYEMYGGYSRGHLTRYSALYTSLASNYEVDFAEGTTQAQPFALNPYGEIKREHLSEVEFRREANWKLKSFRVQSNATAFLHSEQMHDAGGTFLLDQDSSGNYRLSNTTGLELQDVGLLRRDNQGQLWKAWIGELSAEDKPIAISFERSADQSNRFAQWSQSETTESLANIAQRMLAERDMNGDSLLSRDEVADLPNVLRTFSIIDRDYHADGVLDVKEFTECLRISSLTEEMSLGAMFDMVSDNLTLSPGEIRLLGWTPDMLAGMTIKPASTQNHAKTFVLIHLKAGDLPVPLPDSNSSYDFSLREERLEGAVDSENETENETGDEEKSGTDSE